MSYVNPFHYALTALLLFAAVFFTAASAGETNLYGGLIVPPIAWSTPPKPPKTGDFKDDLKHPTTNAFITRFRLFVPEKLPKKRHLALLICFHGRGGNEDGPAELMNRTIKDLGLSDQYIVMGLKSHEIGWEDADEIDVLKAYDWVSSVYPIDRRRVYLIGHSSGAHWDTHFGSKHIDLFAGIMRWAGGSIRPLGGKDAALQTEFYFVHGTKDDQNAISSSREGRENLKRAGCRYVFREVLTGDHGNILSMAPITHDLVWWMDSLRHKTMPLPVDDDKFLKQFATAKLRDKLLPQAETWNELLRIGGPQAGQVVAEAMTSPTAKIREFAALACTKGRFGGEETVAELAKLVDDKSAAVRTATIAALGVEANWRSETAQRALGQLALSKKKVELTDRGDATIQLAKAATLPLLGNYDDDTPLWQALIGLLNDERKEIRTAAFSPLKIAVPDGNGYDPTATGPERAAAIAKWQAWLTAHQLSEENKAAK
jgi:poly(3-hydroxybutyrate) depolymerase